MTPQTEILSTTPPHKADRGWIIEMPKEIAEAFGVPAGLIVTLYPEPGSISAEMDLTEQTAEARGREPGWFIEMPSEMANATAVAKGSFIAVYAKMGCLSVEIMPPPSPDLEVAARRIFEKYKDVFEELKRLGD